MVGSPANDRGSWGFSTKESQANSLPGSPPLVQSQAIAINEEDTPSIRELLHTIDTHVEMVNLEVTSNLNAAVDVQAQQLPSSQPIEEPPTQPVEDATLSQSADPVT